MPTVDNPHILRLEAITDPNRRLQFFRKFKSEIGLEMQPNRQPTVKEAFRMDLRNWMSANPGVSQRELAALLGIQSTSILCDVLAGRKFFSAEKALALSRLLHPQTPRPH